MKVCMRMWPQPDSGKDNIWSHRYVPLLSWKLKVNSIQDIMKEMNLNTQLSTLGQNVTKTHLRTNIHTHSHTHTHTHTYTHTHSHTYKHIHTETHPLTLTQTDTHTETLTDRQNSSERHQDTHKVGTHLLKSFLITHPLTYVVEFWLVYNFLNHLWWTLPSICRSTNHIHGDDIKFHASNRGLETREKLTLIYWPYI